MSHHIIAIDQGTTSTRSIIFSQSGQIVARDQTEFTQLFPQDGWVEHDPEEIWQSVVSTLKGVLNAADMKASDISAVGITNQRETTVIWDRVTGEAIYPAIVWQDRRTAEHCRQLKSDGAAQTVQAKTGLLLDPYFAGTKIGWILDNVAGARARAEKGELAFGTIDSFLVWRLSNGRTHKTDATNAARTLLFNIHTHEWDAELLTLFNIPRELLPEVVDNAAEIAEVDSSLLGATIPITGMAGDQHAALVGQACFSPGMGKSTYGTGCFFLLNTGDKAITSQNRLLTTLAYRIKGQTTFAIEGSIFIAGAAIQWIRDGLKLVESASETATIAQRSTREQSVYVVPAFTGLGAPYWDPDARGAILGLTRNTSGDDIITATLQAICYQTADLISAIKEDGASFASTLRVDGGMVANDWFLGFLSDILDQHIDRPKVTETTALGAAYLAGIGAGIYSSVEELSDQWQCERTFEPSMSTESRERLYEGWKNAVARVRS